MSRLTGWYEAYQRPARAGFYERLTRTANGGDTVLLDYWDGMQWRYGHHSPVCWLQRKPWRGLDAPACRHAGRRHVCARHGQVCPGTCIDFVKRP